MHFLFSAEVFSIFAIGTPKITTQKSCKGQVGSSAAKDYLINRLYHNIEACQTISNYFG
jgi:hypothetical protein